MSVLVVGLVRNCQSNLRADVTRISSALEGFSKVHWFVVESDSSDGTVSLLEGLRDTKRNFDFVSLGVLRDALPVRTERLAHCRNRYLAEIRDNPRYAGIDLVIVADLDGINLKLTRSGVESCFSRNDWDACFANQAGPYYDVWALRHPEWSPNDCWQQAAFLDRIRHRKFLNRRTAVYSRMIRIPTSAPWIPVESAFGGFGIYRAEALRGLLYSAGQNDPQPEHVGFHQRLGASGHKLFINPALVNAGFTEHSRESLLIYRLWRSATHAVPLLIHKVRGAVAARFMRVNAS